MAIASRDLANPPAHDLESVLAAGCVLVTADAARPHRAAARADVAAT